MPRACLPVALIIPAVTDWMNSYGAPNARTHCPVFMESESPSWMAGRFLPFILIRPISVFESVPMMVALNFSLSAVVTVTSVAFFDHVIVS